MPTTVNLGRVQPIYKGAYDSGEVYTPLDFVTYNGASYFCILTTTAGTLPTNTTYWQLVANAALSGAIGFDDASSVLVGANVQTALDSLGANATAAREFLGAHDASNLTTGTVPDAQLGISTTVTLGNNFEGTNNLFLYKIGRMVTAHTSGGISHDAGSSVVSNVVIPEAYRPASVYRNSISLPGSGTTPGFQLNVGIGGSVTVTYPQNDGVNRDDIVSSDTNIWGTWLTAS